MISVVVLVKNGERCLNKVLDAMRNFSEIIVYDTGSSDATLQIAAHFPNVTIFQGEWKGFGEARNRAARLGSHDWILCIDADEVLSPELAEEILSLKLDSSSVYALRYHNYFNGKWIKGSGWYPERHIRLYNKQTTAFSEAMVHEGVIAKGHKEIVLKHPVNHYPYDSIADFLVKMERYSTLFAQQHQHKRKSSPACAYIHGLAAFFKSYFLKRGFLGGYEGYLIAAYNSHTAFYKYLKLYHANIEK